MARFFKLLIAIVPVILIANSIRAQQTNLRVNDLIGTYTHSGRFAGSSITIEPEGKFHINSGDCTQEYYEAGTYTYQGGVISFVKTKSTVKGNGESDEEAKDLLNPKVFEEIYREAPRANSFNDELVPIKWAERLYLIRKDSLDEFCNAINLGLEPRQRPGSDWYLGSFYLRQGDESKPATGRPSIANNLAALLLEKPVESTIKSILREDDSEIAVIDKGSEVGLKAGMRLVINDGGFEVPTLWSGLIVVSAGPHFAKLQLLSDAKVGDKVSSKFVDRRFQ
ncbi:MAG TPA: hypothetical protein VN476_02450 [Pyrinomonadaceae bacterium]|nr:hypothetical protein [Pyrinomonadaceae bacterium]